MMKNNNLPFPNTFFSFLWHFLKNYKPAVCVYVFLALAAGLWGPFNSMLIKNVINILPNIQPNNLSPLILPASLIVANFIIFDNFTWRSISYIRYRFLPFLLYEIDNALLDYTLKHSHQFFQERMAGTLAKNIFHLIDGTVRIVESIAANLLRTSSLLLIGFVFAYRVNSVFFKILLTWSLFFFTVSFFMSKKLTQFGEAEAKTASILGGEIIDSITHAFSVNLFARRSFEIKRRIPSLLNHRAVQQKKEKYALIMNSIQGGLISIMMGLCVFFLVRLYGKGLISIGDFALILGLSMETGHMMWYTMGEVNTLNKEMGRCKQSLLSLIAPIDITDRENASILRCHKGEIAFQNVTFSYKKSQPIFENCSIAIVSGQKVGLVGYSGGGKSTFVNLILRLYDVDSGSILIDNQDIKEVTQDSLHETISMIPQDPALFHRTLMENIRYGRTDASDEEVIVAAQKAHAHEFIERLPEGYSSLVGERGVKLSGGQRQRIAIARAILKNAPILILDEATSQLDSLTENLIQESLWQLMQNKTTLVIAHRLSTLLHMDRILVFDKGKIVQDGAHHDLLAKSGMYKNLWDAQVGGFIMNTKGDEK